MRVRPIRREFRALVVCSLVLASACIDARRAAILLIEYRDTHNPRSQSNLVNPSKYKYVQMPGRRGICCLSFQGHGM